MEIRRIARNYPCASYRLTGAFGSWCYQKFLFPEPNVLLFNTVFAHSYLSVCILFNRIYVFCFACTGKGMKAYQKLMCTFIGFSRGRY